MTSASARLVGRGSLYTFATAGPMLTGVIITPVLTRALTVADYGLVSLGIVVMQFTVGLLALGLPTVITRHVFLEDSADTGARGLAASGAILVLGCATLVSVVGFALDRQGLLDVAPVFFLAVVAGGAGAGVAMAQAWSVANDRALFYVALAFGVSLVAPALGTAAVLAGNGSAVTYFVAAAATFVVVDFVALAALRKAGPIAVKVREFGRSVRMGLPLVPHQLATSSATGATVLVAGVVLGADGSAHTQIALYLGTVPLIITSALSYAWTPIILSAEESERGARMTETARSVGWLAACGGGGVALLSPWLLRLISSGDYDRAAMVPITASVGLVAAVSVVFLAHSQLVVASGKTGAFAWTSPAALLLGALASWACTTTVGLQAAGLGYLVTYLLLSGFARWLAHRRTSVRWQEGVLAPPLLGAVAACAAGAWLPMAGWASAPRLLGALVLAFVGLRLIYTVMTDRKES